MYEMGGCAQIVGEILIRIDCVECCWCSAVAIFADQGVDGLVFAEGIYARREDDELRGISKGHAGTIDCLVAKPGAVKFMRIEVDDGFPERGIQNFEVYLEREFA